MAEREGFEPPGTYAPTVFKTAALGRSATSPKLRYLTANQFPGVESRVLFPFDGNLGKNNIMDS
ncbi:hypothetical protein CCP3SC5AM1_380004 [Gammaproteobacteria bacterium]